MLLVVEQPPPGPQTVTPYRLGQGFIGMLLLLVVVVLISPITYWHYYYCGVLVPHIINSVQ